MNWAGKMMVEFFSTAISAMVQGRADAPRKPTADAGAAPDAVKTSPFRDARLDLLNQTSFRNDIRILCRTLRDAWQSH